MFSSHAIAQLDVVAIAWPAAIRFVSAGTEHAAKDAVLHMKHGNVLMNDNFEVFRLACAGQLNQLISVQVVRRGYATGSPSHEQFETQRIGNVERKIGCKRYRMLSAIVKRRQIADENANPLGPRFIGSQ